MTNTNEAQKMRPAVKVDHTSPTLVEVPAGAPAYQHEAAHMSRIAAIEIGLATGMQINRLMRVYNLATDRLSQRYADLIRDRKMDKAQENKDKQALIRKARRRLFLSTKLGMQSATESEEKESDAITRELARVGFVDDVFFEEAVETGLMTKQELDWILDGKDADGSVLMPPGLVKK